MHKLNTLKRLLSYVKPYKEKALGIILLLLFIMGCSVVTPFLMQIAIDTFIAQKNVPGLLYIGALLTLLTLASMLLSKVRIYAMSQIINTVLIQIRKDLFSHLQTLSFKFFDNRPVGKILSRIVGDVQALQNLLNHSIVNLIPNIFTIVMVLIFMFILNKPLATVCLIVMPFLFMGMFIIEVKSNRLWIKFRKNRSNFLGYSHEAFSGMRIINSFANETYAYNSFNTYLQKYSGSFMTAVKLQDYFWPIVDICRGVGTCVVLLTGFKLYQKGNISIGDVLAFIMYIEMLWEPIMNLASFYNSFVTNLSAAERIFEILDTPSDVKADKLATMPQIQGSISFKDVCFAYDEDSKHALNHLSLNIQAGEKIALVGETGSGKTTITNLVSRFYTATSGSVCIDGIDLKSVDPHSLRSQMGIMLQDSFLFSCSIKENIAYGKLDATDEEIIQAAKAVNADEFICKLTKGYDTCVNERGSRLSQGQRQLIAFARALLADPKILILDEATANIDTQTERLVQKGIHKLMQGRTSIIIAHRLSTIRDCDKILVLSHGQIVESGTHDELMALQGHYYKLYYAQYKFLTAKSS